MNWKLILRNRNRLTPREAASQRRVYIFVVCLVCSAIFWLFIKLSYDTQAVFETEVVFYQFPEGYTGVAQSDSVISFTLESTGIRLIVARFFLPKDLMRFDAGTLPQLKRNDNRYFYLSKNALLEGINYSLEGRARVTDVYPDTVFLQLSPVTEKRLPVSLNASISFERRFDLYGEITINPDSVLVRGPKNVLDTLSAIYTEKWEASGLRKSTDQRLSIQLPKGVPSVTTDKEEVLVRVPVEEFTEASKELPVTIVCPDNLPSQDVRLFPATVRVHYLVAFSDYQAVSEKMFHATVTCPQAISDSDGRLNVRLETYPSFVDILYYRPEYVEYIILE